jgi:hypothetical protein
MLAGIPQMLDNSQLFDLPLLVVLMLELFMVIFITISELSSRGRVFILPWRTLPTIQYILSNLIELCIVFLRLSISGDFCTTRHRRIAFLYRPSTLLRDLFANCSRSDSIREFLNTLAFWCKTRLRFVKVRNETIPCLRLITLVNAILIYIM